jgi:phosphatidylglycerol:prolipoprotein diacylglycerol transferase
VAFPYLSDLLKALTGISVPLPIPTFGAMVALALLTAMSIARSEMERLHAAGCIGTAARRSKVDGQIVVDRIPPQDTIYELGTVVTLAGLFGARIFHLLEYSDYFRADPWGMIFSRSGFTIFGGLICGTIAGAIYLRRRELPTRRVLDVLAPVIMLGYGIGRIGCQLSGDGDWGIPANMTLKPEWLPTWLWAQTYDHNVLGITISPPGVYPTSIYETVMAVILAAVLWTARKNPFQPGWLFSLYLVLGGLERFAIEPIRVNSIVHFLGIRATQAQMISVALIVLGTTGLIVFGRRNNSAAAAI